MNELEKAWKRTVMVKQAFATGRVGVRLPCSGGNGSIQWKWRYATPVVDAAGTITELTIDRLTRNLDLSAPIGKETGPVIFAPMDEGGRRALLWLTRDAAQTTAMPDGFDENAFRSMKIPDGHSAEDMTNEIFSKEQVEGIAEEIVTRLVRRTSVNGAKAHILNGLYHGLVLERVDMKDHGHHIDRWRHRRPVTDEGGRLTGLRRDATVRALLAGWHDLEGFVDKDVGYLRELLVRVPGHPRVRALAPAARDIVGGFVKQQTFALDDGSARENGIVAMLSGEPHDAEGPGPTYEEVAAAIVARRNDEGVQIGADDRTADLIVRAMRMASDEGARREIRRHADRNLPVLAEGRVTLRERIRRAFV